jgi:hypothetical protein
MPPITRQRARRYISRHVRGFDGAQSYTFNDLKSDVKSITTQVFGMPNAQLIDVEGIPRGEKRLKDELNVNMAVLKRHGSWLVTVVAPNTTPPNPKFTIKAVSFRSPYESNEWSA